jgi:FkbM family methyltransferase
MNIGLERASHIRWLRESPISSGVPPIVNAVRRRLLAFALRLMARLGQTEKATRLANKRRPVRWARGADVRMHRWGVPFRLNLDDNVQRTFYYTGWYERPFLEFLGRELGADDVYLDIGAHVGIDATFAARRCLRVVAFEPAPDTAAVLRENVGRIRNITIVPLGLADRTGVMELRNHPAWHPRDAATRSLHGRGDVVARVDVVPFDEWAATHDPIERITVVKMDVEGAELAVLRGMRESLALYKPRMIALELNTMIDAAGSDAHAVHDFLSEVGYRYERTLIENAIFRRDARGSDRSRRAMPLPGGR